MSSCVRDFMSTSARRWLPVLAGFGLVLSGSALWAATQNAVVSGYVYDQAGAAVPGATVRLINANSGFSQAQVTDASGGYTFPSVPPAASYILSVDMKGFAPDFRTDLEINVGDYRVVQPPFILQPLAAAPEAPAQPAAPTPAPPAPTAPETGPTPKPTPPPPTPPPVTATEVAAAAARAPQRAVAAPTVSLDLVNTMMGGVIDTRAIRTLPLANRDFFELALLVPGTYPTEQGSPLEGASLVVNGVRANMNNFLLDGVDNNDYTINQALPFQIVEAMQEFRVQTSASPAEYGRSGGAQINTISRTGVNDLHGSLFEFNRNSALSDSNALSAYRGGTFDAFAQSARVNKIVSGPQAFDYNACSTTGQCGGTFYPTSVMSDPKLANIFDSGRDLPLNQNQFGANLGGRLLKDKAFFFVNWESFRANDPRPVMERVPDDTCRDPNVCAPLYLGTDPNTGLPYSPLYPVSAALAGNLLNLYPVPNVPTSSVLDAFGNPVSDPQMGDVLSNGAFFAGQSQNYTHSDNLLERVDIRASDRLSMSFKHNIQGIQQIQGGSLPLNSTYPGNGTDVDGRNQNFSYNLVGAISDRTVNEFRLGWNRFRLTTLPLDAAPLLGAFHNLNFTGKGLPSVLIGGFAYSQGPYANLGANFSAPSNRADDVTSAADNLSLTRGRHGIKFGGEFRRNNLKVDNEGAARGLITFYSAAWASSTGLPDLASIARTSPALGGSFDRSFRANAFDWFVQDNWRARSNITVTFGLRYEYNQPPLEARNRLINNFPYICKDTFTGLPSPVCLMHVGDATNTIYDSDGTTKGTATFTAAAAGFNSDLRNFSPHLGLAWDPLNKGKTVFRVGYALMYDQMSLQPSVNMLLNPPDVQQAMSFYPYFTLGSAFPAGFPSDFSTTFPDGSVLNGMGAFDPSGEGVDSLWFAQPYSITMRDPNTRTPYVHQFYAGIEQRLGNKAIFEVAYVGSLGHKLLRNRLLLQCTADTFTSPFTDANPAGPLACLPRTFGQGYLASFFGSASPYGIPIAELGWGSASDSVIDQETSANANYHSLQARFDTRGFHGLSAHVHYMWAHSIDDASSPVAPVFLLSPGAASLTALFSGINPDELAALNNANPTLSLRPGFPSIITRGLLPSDSMNSANLEGERASSDFDIRHRVVAYYTYDLPKVEGLRGLGNGWEVAGVTTFQKGQPFSVFGDFFGVPLRPDHLNATAIDNSNPAGAIDNALPAGCNTTQFLRCTGASAVSSFGLTPTLNFNAGSLPRNSFIGPRLFNFDFSILKNTYLGAGERRNLQFRVEFFNLFNRTNFRQPFSQEGQFASLACSLFDPSSLPPACAKNPAGAWGFDFVNPFFGQILQSYEPRSIQLALKFLF